jgi:hypothetical protein
MKIRLQKLQLSQETLRNLTVHNSNSGLARFAVTGECTHPKTQCLACPPK